MYPRILFIIPTTNIVVERAIEDFNHKFKMFDSYVFKIPVKTISALNQSDNQFDSFNFVKIISESSELNFNMIVWAGTSGSWLGLDHELQLMDEIKKHAKCPFVSCYAEIINQLEYKDVSEINLLTPYSEIIHNKIIQNFINLGIKVLNNKYYDYTNNFSFSNISTRSIYSECALLSMNNEKICIPMCTNIWSYKIIDSFEEEYGIQIVDPINILFNKIIKFFNLNVTNNLGMFFN
ncbi:hypothetical protein HF673_19710 [Acidithiobacillus thiooxidans]|uniref:Asp/Glu/hydantoin racemase n=1 Tax=Acidithiobacillus sulfurivorans TaxID=1958756 RepID=A0ABS6A2V3_9PROT|nr:MULTISPECIES: hypothetical protein [Acidithiobacillus]MBU2761541.1 hypothetical protein [Acidithiobacillus sulfurivorans]MBU2837887.1 hypothetical protein [Acidithiobacillus thiooxidans]